ncbi:hypothetical protein DFH09DRAFT_1084729 [Mycena vulgaris]|nr:hypothetical protein DFH09DRAFT_1084729 [Mycena vulgaris]
MITRLNATLESFKAKAQSTDKKTAFWTAYNKLADEFDKEFQAKYGGDLDTGLIFVQPELQPNPNAVTQALLRIIVQNMTGVADPAPMFTQTGPATIILVAQSLWYFSLLTTLLAALLAVLGKQWLMNYNSAGERGTIEDRGLERQRKLDGLQRWKFHLFMQIFPLLLQFALLLFAVALSIYLWTIHRALAAIVLSVTALGFILYAVMVISTLWSPDSPFQTPLTALLVAVLKFIPFPQFLHRYAQTSAKTLFTALAVLRGSLAQAYSNFTKATPQVLPYINTPASKPTLRKPVRIFDEIPPPSAEVSAIIWALETSTDPQLVEAAAAVVPDLQWPINLDLQPSMTRLADTFNGCFSVESVSWYEEIPARKGMDERATSCIKAFSLLEILCQQRADPWTFKHRKIANSPTSSELQRMLQTFSVIRGRGRTLFDEVPVYTQWTLRLLSTRSPYHYNFELKEIFRYDQPDLSNTSIFADFLFCINSFFVPPDVRDLSLMDKSQHCDRLADLLFENLLKGFPDDHSPDPDIIGQVMGILLKSSYGFKFLGRAHQWKKPVYLICAVRNIGLPTMTWALRAVRVDWGNLYKAELSVLRININPMADVEWVYDTVEELEASQPMDPAVFGDFLQVFVYYGHVPHTVKPTTAIFRGILWALTPDATHGSTQILAFELLCAAHRWFQDNELRLVLQEHSVWANLGLILNKARDVYYPDVVHQMTAHYITLGAELSQTSEWQSIIMEDLTGWLANLPTLLIGFKEETESTQEFCAVICRLWEAEAAEGTESVGVKLLVAAFTGLTSVWNHFDFPISLEIHRVVRLVECTVSTAFCARISTAGNCSVPVYRTISLNDGLTDRFKNIIMPKLCHAVVRVAERAKEEASTLDLAPDLKVLLIHVTELMLKLASTINGELRNGWSQGEADTQGDEFQYWTGLKKTFEKDLHGLATVLRDGAGYGSGFSDFNVKYP